MQFFATSHSKKNLIFTAYANKHTAQSGANLKDQSKRSEIYYKNIIVALLSAKANNNDCDVALVTNEDVPSVFKQILEKHKIAIILCPYNSFQFEDSYPWCLAFYKLCALKKILGLQYENYLMIDSDVFIQNDISMLWNWTPDYLVVFDTCETTQRWQNEMHSFLDNETFITHWGGGIYRRVP